MTDQLRGSVRPRILTREHAAYLLQSLSCSRGDGGGGGGAAGDDGGDDDGGGDDGGKTTGPAPKANER